MIMLTGQKAIMSGGEARFQIVDIVATMRPLTKMTRQIVMPAAIAAIVRDAFRVAQEENQEPGASGIALGGMSPASRLTAPDDRGTRSMAGRAQARCSIERRDDFGRQAAGR